MPSGYRRFLSHSRQVASSGNCFWKSFSVYGSIFGLRLLWAMESLPMSDLSISELARRCSESFRQWSEGRVQALDRTMGAALGSVPNLDFSEQQRPRPLAIQTDDQTGPPAVSSFPALSR